MLKLVISDDEGKTTVVPLVRDEITIGRKEGNTIRLTERNVSRRHARLFKNGGNAFTIEDLGSYNGIKVNGRKIREPSTLKAGDQVTIGDYLLALQVDSAETATEPTTPMAPPGTAEAQTAMIAAPAAEPTPPARLVMLSPPAPGAEFALSKESTRFGRAEDLDAWVNHRSISREHAEIVQDGQGGYRVRDLGSANGLRLNGEEVRDAGLSAGDVIEMGQVRFRFVGRGEAYVFDADRTIQMEAVPEGGGSRAPIFAALGIIVVAVAIGGVIAMSGADEEEPVATQIEDTPPGSATPPGAGDPVAEAAAGESEQAFEEALRNCQTALEEERFAEAVSHGNAAVSLRPDDESAERCQADAQQAQAERETFERGKEALEGGDIDEAYFAFEELPDDSPFRDTAEVERANEQFAQEHVRLATESLRRNPQEAERHASMVLTMSSPPAQQQQAALSLRRQARRRGATQSPTNTSAVRRAVRTEPRERTPRETSSQQQTSSAASSGGGGGDPIARCRQEMASGGSYTQCIIRSLEGRARTARELEALIESYRASGNQPAAHRHMQNYIRRYPSTSKARNYRQILAAHGIGP